MVCPNDFFFYRIRSTPAPQTLLPEVAPPNLISKWNVNISIRWNDARKPVLTLPLCQGICHLLLLIHQNSNGGIIQRMLWYVLRFLFSFSELSTTRYWVWCPAVNVACGPQQPHQAGFFFVWSQVAGMFLGLHLFFKCFKCFIFVCVLFIFICALWMFFLWWVFGLMLGNEFPLKNNPFLS